MTILEIQKKIQKLKAEKDIGILAHSYQAREILEVADVSGDSFALAKAATEMPQSTIVVCGVRFMAEGVKLLSPKKNVILANADAGCPMADNLTAERLLRAQEKHPGYSTVCYINTTTEIKAMCDVCVTSSSAVSIVNKIENHNILFVPDCNLGAYVQQQCPNKNFALISGGCPIHAAVTFFDLKNAKAKHPNALVLVHPECVPDVVSKADYVGSTQGIMDFARASEHCEFIIGTEISIAEHLSYELPEKRFYPISKQLMCHNMKITTLPDVLNSLDGGGEEIIVPADIAKKAVKCIGEMIRLG
jgi:quinolinate synthetase complex, A subunit